MDIMDTTYNWHTCVNIEQSAAQNTLHKIAGLTMLGSAIASARAGLYENSIFKSDVSICFWADYCN